MLLEYFVISCIGICASAILFDLDLLVKYRSADRKYAKIYKIMSNNLYSQINTIQNTHEINRELHQKLIDCMTTNVNIAAFIIIIDEYRKTDFYSIQEYLSHCDDLAMVILKRKIKQNNQNKAFNYYAIYKIFEIETNCNLNATDSTREIISIIKDNLKNESIYVRENGSKAITKIGNIEDILEVIYIANEQYRIQANNRIENMLHETNLNTDDLASRLLQILPGLNSIIQLGIMQYLNTLQSQEYQEKFNRMIYEFIKDNQCDDEVKKQIIHYFYLHVYPYAKDLLVECLTSCENSSIRLEAAKALGNYSGKKVIDSLIFHLNDRDWEVRYNSLKSLIQHQISVDSLVYLGFKEDILSMYNSIIEEKKEMMSGGI